MMYTLHAPTSIGPAANQFASDGEDARFDLVTAIPDGMAKWALILPPFWLAWHRLWGALAVYTAVTASLFLLLGTAYTLIALFLAGLPGLYLLLEGHNLRRDALERSGWQLLDVVEARDEGEAVLRYLHRWRESDGLPNAPANATTNAPTSAPTRSWGSKPAFETATALRHADDDGLAFGLFPDRTD